MVETPKLLKGWVIMSKGFSIKGISLFIITCMVLIMIVAVLFLTRKTEEPVKEDKKVSTIKILVQEMKEDPDRFISGSIKYNQNKIGYTVKSQDANKKVVMELFKDNVMEKGLEYYETADLRYIYLPNEKKYLTLQNDLVDGNFTFFDLAARFLDNKEIQEVEGSYQWKVKVTDLATELNSVFENVVTDFIQLGFTSLIEEDQQDKKNQLVKELIEQYLTDEEIQFTFSNTVDGLQLDLQGNSVLGPFKISETVKKNQGAIDIRKIEEDKKVTLEEYLFIG